MSEDTRGWVYLGCNDAWHEAESRDEAVKLAHEAFALEHRSSPSVAKIGRAFPITYSHTVSGLGEDVRERLNAIADDLVGEAAEDYPDMPIRPFDEALEAFVLDWLEKHAAKPEFFQVEDEEIVT